MEQLVGRYDLLEQVTRGKGRTLWRAHDNVLDRPVGVLLLDSDHPHGDGVRAAAQQAARVESPGLLRVIDADTTDGRVFVVTRWLTGTTLSQRLETGPLLPGEAAQIVGSVARSLVAAAAEGVHHLVLDPRDVLLTEHGVALVGVGVRAALEGVTPEADAEQVDAWRLGALLYAALTGRWPGHTCAGLPAAPTVAGRVARPRQVRAGIPLKLDDIAWRSVQPDAPDPLETPRAIAQALEEASNEVSHDLDEPPPTRSVWPAVGISAVVALLLAGALMVAWQFWQDRNRPELDSQASPSQSSDVLTTPSQSPTAEPGLPVNIASATAFDPAGDNVENDEEAAFAIDEDSATAWSTVTYASRELGDLKPGVGLRLRLSGVQSVGAIEIELVGRGTDLEVWAQKGDSSPPSADDPLDGYRLLASATGAGDDSTHVFIPPAQTKAIVIWLTALPADVDGYRGGISEVRLTS